MVLPFGVHLAILIGLLQTWHELKFDLGGPDDIEAFPWSTPVSIAVVVLVMFLVWKARRNYLALPELPAVEGDEKADVTVVIPTRNEEQTIGRCVKSLKPYRVLVVDDKSRDRTAQQAQGAGAEVIPAAPAHRGVLARPNALSTGDQLATTQFILFADPDTWFAPNFVASAARYASQNELILLSPYLRERRVTMTAKLLSPYAAALYFCGVNPHHAQDVLKPGTYANGQCMLFLRTAYEFFGGFRSVQTVPMDDIAIAQKVKRHRMKLRIMRAEHLGTVERNWSKRSALRVLRPSGKTAMLAVLTSVLLISLLPLGGWMVRQEQWAFLPVLLLPGLLFIPWYGGVSGVVLYLPAAYMFIWRAVREYAGGLFGSKAS
jgi:hypothetical protein